MSITQKNLDIISRHCSNDVVDHLQEDDSNMNV